VARRMNPRYVRSEPIPQPEPRRDQSGHAPPSRSALRRWLRRHRWQMVPVEVGVGAYAVAAVADVAPAYGYSALAIAGGAGLALAQRLTPAEQLYGRLVVAGGAGWVVLADLAGPWTLGAASLWATGLWAGGTPWWRSHRVRGRIRVDELVEAWPDWSRRAGLGGVRVVSATAGRAYDRLRLEVVRGQQRARHVVDHLEDLACVRGIPVWRLRIDPQGGGEDPGQLDLLVTHTDPWRNPHGEPIPLPHPAIEDLTAWCQPASMLDPIRWGVSADGPIATLALRNERGGRAIAIASKKGGGKTVLLHNILAGLCPMVDVDVAVIDCKEHGKASRPWAPRLIRRATTPADAIALLRWAAAENDRRGAASPDPVLRPTAQRRALVVVIDEYGALVLSDENVKEHVEALARKIRSASGALVIADQRPDHSTWTGALRGQLDEVVVGRLENRRDVKAILPSVEGVDPTEFILPGQMVQQAGKRGRQIEARTWHLEDPADIAAIVEACRDRWPTEQIVTPNTSRSTSELEKTLELPRRGEGAEQVRAQIRAALDGLAAQDHAGIPDLSAEEIRQRGQATPLPTPTAEEATLDERIMEAIRTTEGGIAMADLEREVGAPRSTIQVRCSTLRRQGRVYAQPARGRHARWHITDSEQPAMSNT
jgi:DNA segregation ATPase FtsK/SpoIIIE, S-DNA-T family